MPGAVRAGRPPPPDDSGEQASANVNAAEAAVDAAESNVTFTRIEAPISGIVSRAALTAGDLVNTGQIMMESSPPQATPPPYTEKTARR